MNIEELQKRLEQVNKMRYKLNYSINREDALVRRKKRFDNNKEEVLASQREWYANNSQKVKDRIYKYRNENREEYLAKSRGYAKAYRDRIKLERNATK